MKRFKDDAREINTGYEGGLSIENYNDVKKAILSKPTSLNRAVGEGYERKKTRRIGHEIMKSLLKVIQT